MLLRRRPRRPSVRTRGLAVAAGLATVAVVAAEAAHLRSRWRAAARADDAPAAAADGAPPAIAETARETMHVLVAGHRAATANETALLHLFLSFGATFAAARAVTHSIRRGVGPARNVRVGDRHIHHFVPGILLALLAGGASIGMRHETLDAWLAVPFGVGAALVVDETALLIELSDVYWSDRGVLSIDVGLGATTALACLALVVRVVRRGEQAVGAA
ncbi:hypothetical protein [Patulibacter sp. SYSU D01012]|uniref:hypothetical protein n=1 Tax=Patulibacter sp. SYSU D01012 TaxID=2817381 RepID=UPI001B3140E9|nr:hypothetical protein [Patulibacter sp. SYSU D01012]